ncbi:hypothetical protein BB561_001532 [Smittium simulii]|uniref:Uncharacterized protein n=1 Tax=Smittium simulii TaxID=133385 RepID=A0A2T9YUA9_9FUNG|nr:hypothetical protein BB561_001532 [Smittium simulii]
MQKLLRKYTLASEVHPIKVLSITNAIICALGDVISQNLSIKRDGGKLAISLSQLEYNPMRTARFAVWGFIMGPIVNRWYLYLNRHFPLHTNKVNGKLHSKKSKNKELDIANAQTTPQSVMAHKLEAAGSLLKRVAADQLVFAPVGLLAFFAYMNVAENKSISALSYTLSEKYIETLKSNYLIWPLFQLLNFSLVPVQFRVPVGGVFGILWTVYLSYINSR